MFKDTTDRETARRLIGLMFDARGLARRFGKPVCVSVTPDDFTISVLEPTRVADGSDTLLLPSSGACIEATTDDDALNVFAVQIATALAPIHAVQSARR